MQVPSYASNLDQKASNLAAGNVTGASQSEKDKASQTAFQTLAGNLQDKSSKSAAEVNNSGSAGAVPQKAGNSPDRDLKANLDWFCQDIPSVVNLYKSIRSEEEGKLNSARQIPKTGLDMDLMVDQMYLVVDDWNQRLPTVSYAVIRSLGWISRISAYQLSHRVFDKVNRDGIPLLASAVEKKFDDLEVGLWNTTGKAELAKLRTTTKKLETARAYITLIKFSNVEKLFFDTDVVRTHSERSLGWIRPEFVYEKAIQDSATELDRTMNAAEASKLARAIMRLLPKSSQVVQSVEKPMQAAQSLGAQLQQTNTFMEIF